MDRAEMLKDVKSKIYLNDKFLGNKLQREMIQTVTRTYGYIGPLDMHVCHLSKAILIKSNILKIYLQIQLLLRQY